MAEGVQWQAGFVVEVATVAARPLGNQDILVRRPEHFNLLLEDLCDYADAVLVDLTCVSKKSFQPGW